jgi:hypothetical protein
MGLNHQSSPPPLSEGATFCPACGYDLRATGGERCSECGLVLDRADLARSNFPWVYRQTRGRLGAFLSTVWGVTLDQRILRHEAVKPQVVAEALKFRRRVAALVVVAFSGIAGLLLGVQGADRLVVEFPQVWFNPSSVKVIRALPPLADLVVPWVAGVVTVPPLIAVYAALAALTIVRAPLNVLRPDSAVESSEDAVRTIGCYVTGPLVFLFTAAIGIAVTVLADRLFRQPNQKMARTLALTAGSVLSLTVFVAIVAAVVRTGQWRARLTRRGPGIGVLAMAELLLRWLLAIVFWSGVVPWCLGFIWIVIDSFRF